MNTVKLLNYTKKMHLFIIFLNLFFKVLIQFIKVIIQKSSSVQNATC